MTTILENIGNTPMVELQRIPQAAGLKCKMFVKVRCHALMSGWGGGGKGGGYALGMASAAVCTHCENGLHDGLEPNWLVFCKWRREVGS